MTQPPPAATPCDLGDRRNRQALEAIDHRFHAPFVGEAVVAGGEPGELPDVGAGDERVAVGAKHEDADGVGSLDLVAGRRERVVHRPGHGVACLRSIERQERDGAVGREQHLRSGHR